MKPKKGDEKKMTEKEKLKEEKEKSKMDQGPSEGKKDDTRELDGAAYFAFADGI